MASAVNGLTNTIGKQLNKLRLANNLTPEFIAKKLNITKRAYTHYEKACRRPTLDSLLVLSDLYKVPLEYFVRPERINSSLAAPLIFEDSEKPSRTPSPTALISFLEKISVSKELLFIVFCDAFHLDPKRCMILRIFLHVLTSNQDHDTKPSAAKGNKKSGSKAAPDPDDFLSEFD